MSPAVEILQLDAKEKEHLHNLLNYTERHPDGWTPKPDYEGMHEYSHKDVHHIIQPIIEAVRISSLLREWHLTIHEA